MRKLSKKIKLVSGIAISLIVIATIIVLLYLKDNSNRILFKSLYTNYAWDTISRGYYIYSNGVIKEYDDYNEDRELKSARITNGELNQLKKLANKVENAYEKKDNAWFDAGTLTKQIYSNRLSMWVVLSQNGDSMVCNSTETSKEILKLTNELCDKYLTADDGTNWVRSDNKLFELFD